jgi:hypothetical protein
VAHFLSSLILTWHHHGNTTCSTHLAFVLRLSLSVCIARRHPSFALSAIGGSRERGVPRRMAALDDAAP